MKTLTDLERRAYADNLPELAALYARLDDALRMRNDLIDALDMLMTDPENEVYRNHAIDTTRRAVRAKDSGL